MSKSFDIIVYGATGFTGQLVVEYFDQNNLKDIRWAIAGRNKDKLEHIKSKCVNTAPNIILADATDASAIEYLVRSTKVVLTTVGPYAMYGSLLVRACAELGTHYCDLSGEVQWIKKTIDETYEQAKKSGSRIVHCCGFDSIPSDIGAHILQQEFIKKFGQPAHTIKLGVSDTRGGVSGGTVASLLNSMDEAARDREVKLVMADACSLNHPQNKWHTVGEDPGGHYDPDLGWVAPFVMAAINTRVVRRSASLLPEIYGNEFEYQEYTALGDGLSKAVLAKAARLGFSIGYACTQLSLGRKLIYILLPKPGEGPSKEKRDGGYFKINLVALGESDQKLLLKIDGKGDPGYGATSKMLAVAGLHLAREQWRPGSQPGNHPTAYNFDHRFTESLAKVGITFTLVDSF